MKKPRTPRDAASMAAYSRRRVESEVQYWHVAGGGGGGGVGAMSSGSLRVGNWKN
jgi:ABC-type phosphate/phosphonate transport system permease subunit